MIAFMIIALLVLSFLSLPISWSLGVASYGAILIDGGYDVAVLAQKFIGGMNSFTLMAVPFFILSGNLMTGGGLTKKLLNISRAICGSIAGSMSIVCIVSSCFFGAVSGSAIATASAIGGMTIPEMIKDKYSPSYAAAVATGGAICGPMIPPSIGLIAYASVTSISVQKLFLGTVIPGILYGGLLCLTAYLIAKKRHYPTNPKATLKQFFTAVRQGVFAIIMPIIILGCIFGGITTPTEASVIAVAYALIIGFFIHKDLTLKKAYQIFLDSAVTTSTMFLMFGASKVIAWLVTITNVSANLNTWISTVTNSRLLIIVFITAVCLIFGCLLDQVCAILILTPVFYTMAGSLGYSPAEFGVILVTLLTLGHITPPVGASLLLANSIAKAPIGRTIIESIPFFLCGFGLCILLWMFPALISCLG